VSTCRKSTARIPAARLPWIGWREIAGFEAAPGGLQRDVAPRSPPSWGCWRGSNPRVPKSRTSVGQQNFGQHRRALPPAASTWSPWPLRRVPRSSGAAANRPTRCLAHRRGPP
jgi:hypothetical protein